MLLFYSAATQKEHFKACQQAGLVKTGFQAQKFNQLIVEGLSRHTKVLSIGNLPYVPGNNNTIEEFRGQEGNAQYIALACHPGKKRKLCNFRDAWKYGNRAAKENTLEGIICDGINPLAALVSLALAKKHGVPALCVITDIPSILSEHPSAFGRLDEKLMKQFDGYILLTQAMNPLVNPDNKPYIVMEGLCDFSAGLEAPEREREKTCLYTGSLAPNTGIEALVEGFRRHGPEGYTLEICGAGPLADTLFSKPTPGVRYCGSVTNQEAVAKQRKASLLINPRPVGLKYTETSFPSKLMEYMASGTPVMTTMLPGIPPEYFSYVYAARDDTPDGLGREISRILSLPEEERLELGAAAQSYVVERKNNVAQCGRIMELVRRCGGKG